MSETLTTPTREEIQDSVARGEESKWNVGPDGEMLSEGYTMNDLGEVVWVGQGTAPDDKTAKIEETEIVEKPVEEVAEEKATTTSNPLEKMFNYISDKKYYSKTYDEFKEQYSTEEAQGKLYDFVKKKKAYSKSKGEFLDQYFPIPNEKETIEVKEDQALTDTTGTDGNTVSTGEDASLVTPEVDWSSPDLKGKWNYTSDDIGQSIWIREYEVENEDGTTEMVSEIVPTDNVPKEVLKQWEQSSEVGDEIEGGQQGQTAWEFVAGKKDPIITTTPVMENVANFKANVQETEEIKNNISSEVELWKENQIKIKELNDQIKSTSSVVIPNVGQLPLGPDGKLPEFYNQEAQKEAQKQTEFRQRLLEGRNETEASIKNSRIGNYLQQAAKLWPENEPISNRTDEWLYETATQLMQTDDEQGLMDKKIAEYMEDNQGILQVMNPEWAEKEIDKANEYKESLTEKQEANLAQQNFLAKDIKNSDTKIESYENTLNNIDYSSYEDQITEWDKQISALGVELDEEGRAIKEYPQETIDEYNRLNVERNKVVKDYEVDFESNKKLYQDYTNEVSNRKKSYQSYLNTVNLDTEFNQQGTDLVNYMNAMNRNGHNLTAAVTWVGTSALHMASGIEGAVNAVAELPEDLLFEYYNGDINKMPEAVKMIYAIDGVKDAMRNVKKDTFNKFVEDMNANVQAPTQYEDIDNLSDLGAFGLNVVANFVPQYGLMYATGGASIYIMGTSAFGNKYDNIEFTNRQTFGRTNYTLAEKWLASGVAFGSEVISESFTYGVFKAKAAGMSNMSYERVKNAFGKNVFETGKRVAKRTASNLPYMYQESVSEGFAELGNNFGDKYVLGKDISMGQGIPGAMLSGLFMERAMSMPTLYQDVSSIFAGKNYKQKIAENNTKRKEKEKLLAKKDLDPKTREKLENDILKLVAKNEDLMQKNIQNIDMMSNEEKENLVKLDTEIIELRATEDAINADESLSDDQKQTLIDDIRIQENELLDKQDDIIVEYETEEQQAEKKERYEKQLAQIKKKINKFNKRKIKDFRATNTGARGRVKVFETREEQQAFFNEQISEENALLQAQIDAWNEILKDPTKLNEELKELIGLNDGDALFDKHVNDINSNIKKLKLKIEMNSYNAQLQATGYGAFRADQYGGFDIFINKENSLKKGGRINTAAHELLHAVLFQSIQEDPETQASLGNAVKDFILDNKGGFNRKFIRRMEPYQGDSEFGEEIITIMSESIMDGTLDYKENMFTKFGDIIRQHLQRLGLRDITFDSGKDVYNFIKDYNASIEKNYDSIAIEKMMDKGAKGKLLRKKKARPTGKKMESKAESAKGILNKLAKDKDGNFDKSEYNPNSDVIAAELPGMIAAQVNNYFAKRPSLKITKDGREELEQDVLFRLYATTKEGKNDLNRFDGRGDLYGYLNGRIKYRMLDSFEFNPTIMPDFTQEQLEEGRAQLEDEITTQETPKKQTPTRQLIALETFGEAELHNEIKNDLLELGVDGVNKYLDVKKAVTAHRKFTKDGVEITLEYKAKQKKLEKAAIEKYKKQGFTEKEAKAQAKKDHGVVELKSKRIPTGKYYSILEKVAAKYGITDPIRLITEKDLDTKQRKSAQDYILNKRDEHIVSIPEGTTQAGDPTGIANTIIGKEFFKAGGRLKFKTTGTGKGLKNQAKQRIEPAAYLEIFGLIPKARVNKPSVDPALRSQIIQTTVIAINQAIRQQQDALKLSQERVDKIKDGKGKLMFAKKELRGEDIGAKVETKEDYQNLYENKLFVYGEGIHGIIRVPNKQVPDGFKKDGTPKTYSTRNLDAPFVYRDEDGNIVETGENYRQAGVRVVNRFLESHPQFRQLIKITTTGGKKAGFFQSVTNFDNLINKTIVDQAYISRTKYGTDSKARFGSGKYSEKFHSKLLKGEFNQENKDRLPLLYDFYKAIEAHLQNFPEDVWMFEEILLDTGKQQNVFTRILAPFSFYAVDGDGNPIFDQKIKEEHTDPQNLIGKALLGGAVFGKVDEVWKVVGKSYMQGAILDSDANPHDKMIEDAGYGEKMPQVYYDKIVPRLLSGELKLPNGYSSIVRLAEAGIDLNMYKLVAEGVTIAEYFGVEGMEVSRANRLVVAQLTGDATLQFAKAMNKANLKTQIQEHSRLKKAINKNRMMMSKPSQGITVLDFDDTLATSKSEVISTAPDAQAKIQAEADRLSRLTYQDYTDIGGETAPNTDIIGDRSAYSIANEDTSEYERKKRRWERDYAEKKEMREKKSEEYLRAYKEGDAKTKREIEIDAGAIRKLTAEQFAKEGADLLEQGWKHDFSEFNKVVDGKVASLFNKAMKLQGKFGPENMFVLTARPQESAQSIYEFLKANGLNIPLKNITGLANSTSEAKALWIADKVGEGYNDFYFADDALQNVQAVDNMLKQFDVKSKVQQAKIKFSKDASNTFNDIIESTTNVESIKEFSDAQARLRGQKTKYKSIIPASAQDFQGLLYNFLGKGKKGEADMAFFKKALIDPFARGINELNSSRQSAANDFENLNKNFPDVKKKLNKNIKGLDYTYDQAMRVYLWNQHGFEVPGLSKRDLAALTSVVQNDPKLQAYADAIGLISKKEDGYSKPKDYWLAESIASDLLSDGAIGDKRSDFLAEWIENKNMIFSPKNLNKIEAIYGSKFREALEDMLYRMETGRNRPMGGGRLVNGFMNWTNNSVGAIMFLNLRSATLQTISAANYMNWTDNNPAKAAVAFANQPQFWKDFTYIFNSDYLKQRRSGNQRGVNEAELSEAVAGSDNKAKAAIAWLLKKGFTPTQIADSFAISMGGSTFYRNRIKTYKKQGMSTKEAEAKAWLDFQEITEVNQQSARPDMISQQQASPLGRLILAFQNTPMQYARIMNKATRDLVNGRGDYKTHISKIAYYGVVQSIIFGALQSALYASLGDDEEEEFDKKKERILSQMVDSWLTGIGYGGKAIGTVKNTLMEYFKQRDKGFQSDHAYTLLTLLSFSPPIGSKLRKIYSSIQTEEFNRGVFSKRGFSLDNPIWSGVGNVIEGVTNIPLGRMSNLMLQLDNAMDPAHKWWERVALLLGQNTWDLGIQDPDIEAIKLEIKSEKKKISKEKLKEKKKEKKKADLKEKEAKGVEKQKKEKKEGKQVTCLVCKLPIESGKKYCTVHEKTQKRKDGKEVQCRKRKKNGERCGMITTNKSGYCYYHD